jgi:LuxR family transcriptional regulator, quorum-sensing system regulator BjaR1
VLVPDFVGTKRAALIAMGQITFPTILGFSETCLNARTPTDITDAFTGLLAHEGISSWFVGSFAHVSSGRGFGFYGIPPVWHGHYIDEKYFDDDPVFKHALAGKPRITWSDCRRAAAAEGIGERSLRVFDEAAECGLKDGFIMPVHGISDLPGCVTYGGDDLDLGEDMQTSLFLVGAYAFEGLRRLVENTRPVPPIFTTQELRVLRWSARGKSATDIAKIMDLSPHTVRAHHNKIKVKYGVFTMIQACVCAAVDGTLRIAEAA